MDRIRVTANLPPSLAAELRQAQRPGESLSEAVSRLIERGLLVELALDGAAGMARLEAGQQTAIEAQRIQAAELARLADHQERIAAAYRGLVEQLTKVLNK